MSYEDWHRERSWMTVLGDALALAVAVPLMGVVGLVDLVADSVRALGLRLGGRS